MHIERRRVYSPREVSRIIPSLQPARIRKFVRDGLLDAARTSPSRSGRLLITGQAVEDLLERLKPNVVAGMVNPRGSE